MWHRLLAMHLRNCIKGKCALNRNMQVLAPKLGKKRRANSTKSSSRMMQLSRELRKQGWGQKKDADGDSDSSDLLSPEITRSGPTPTQELKKKATLLGA